MFDVDWTDYDRELVGERKARKEVEKGSKKDDANSVHSSVSNKSSISSIDKTFSFFGSLGRKKSSTSSKKKKILPSFHHTPKDDDGTSQQSSTGRAPGTSSSSASTPLSFGPNDETKAANQTGGSLSDGRDRSSKGDSFHFLCSMQACTDVTDPNRISLLENIAYDKSNTGI